MKKIVVFVLTVLIASFAISCRDTEVDPKDAPAKAMIDALQKLYAHDYDAYLSCAELDGEDDSVHMELYKQILAQHQEYQYSAKGNVVEFDVVDVKFSGDTVCTVLYQLAFPDSTKEISSQKMVRVGDDWKIKIRN